jgi:pimeloyl-ACP methyl ester carboxylesterase
MIIVWIFSAFVIVLMALFGMYFLLNPEKKNLDEAARVKAGGSYTALSDGITHYSLEGSDGKPVVVLVHGGITPSVTWDEYVPELTSAGFQSLIYDHFGRGYSDRPDAVYDRALYRRQLLELLNDLNLTEPVDMVGFSQGGGICVDFANMYPQRVRKLVLIAPIIHQYSLRPLLRPHIIGDFFGRIIALREVINYLRYSKNGSEVIKRRVWILRDQTRYRGFQHSLLSMARTDAISDYFECYKELASQEREILLIRGRDDEEISTSAIEQLLQIMPHIQLHTLPFGTHSMVFKFAKQVSPILVSFLAGNYTEDE